ncbi:MAG: DUF5990 family protein [Pseudomonadota bacterium]
MSRQASFRIIVEAPPPGVAWVLQRRRDEAEPPVGNDGNSLTFEFELTVADAEAAPPRLTGAFAQGPPKKRFVYLCTGHRAGQPHSPWQRRAKIHLDSLTAELLAQASAEGGVLVTRIHGCAKDDGPACATVPLLVPWGLAD